MSNYNKEFARCWLKWAKEDFREHGEGCTGSWFCLFLWQYYKGLE